MPATRTTPAWTSAASTRRQSVREGRILSAQRSQPAATVPGSSRLGALHLARHSQAQELAVAVVEAARSRPRRPRVGRCRRSRSRSPTAGDRLAPARSTARPDARPRRRSPAGISAAHGGTIPLGARSSLTSASLARFQASGSPSVPPTPARSARAAWSRSRWETRWTKSRPRSSTAMASSTSGSAWTCQPRSTAMVPDSSAGWTCAANSALAR